MSPAVFFRMFNAYGRGELARAGELDGLPAVALTLLARRRRARGFYDGLTAELFRRAWLQRRSPRALFDYLAYQRDLGVWLSAEDADRLASVIAELPASRRLIALAMLVESAPERVEGGLVSELAAEACRLPALAARVQRVGRSCRHDLARIESEQQEWREAFARELKQQQPNGICVVGNAGALQGSRLATDIDRHARVVRFNHFRGPHTDAADVGQKVDIWVRSPGFAGVQPVTVPWVVLSGPDMRYRLQNWSWAEEFLRRGQPVLTVPLPVWRNLVQELQAPPSAGLLFLAWLRQMLGGWVGVTAAGFGAVDGGPYHHARVRQRAGARHNWPAERVLLDKWRLQGLQWITTEGWQ